MSCVGANSFFSLNIPDTKLEFHLQELEKIPFQHYEYVFVPHRHESHADHRCVYDAAKKLLKSGKTRLVSYEVWSTLPVVSTYMDISSVVSKKIDQFLSVSDDPD